MKAVIMAAGRGSRLMPLTENVPKSLVKVNGVPMLELMLKQLKSAGITEVVIIVHHLKGEVMNYCEGSPLGMRVTCVEQTEMKGTGDAVLHAEPYIKDEKFLCVAVDSLFETSLLKKLMETRGEGVIACRRVEDPRRYGVLAIDGEQVIDIIEKPQDPPSNLVNFSVYVFPHAIFDACKELTPSPRGELEVTDAIKILIDRGADFRYVESEHIIDIGTHEQLKEAEALAVKLGL